MDLVVVFRTHSDFEASIVRGLLEANGVMSLVSSAVAHSLFPLTINGLGEVRISVRAEEADDAQRIIADHRTELPNGQVVRLRDEFDALQQAIDYRFRDRGRLKHAMTQTSRANEDISGGVTDNESLESWATPSSGSWSRTCSSGSVPSSTKVRNRRSSRRWCRPRRWR